ncbi:MULTISPECIES: hypothetical protein [Citrobacter]|uniref:Uncharacterized protein n=1 Tax=Citrobacter braakii TaxID=57706 RepID=A0ABR6TTD6_CITBR|nr:MULTISPECIES: hypothetical protein [Citrobacter]MBC2610060.1 hypothetical protein [Citrobacter braakii]MBC2634100.1 hypothetical protein [Citrobacter braakii]MBC2646819.1 hypothetical protein [Citrobacter braakii]MDM3430656.1 hypothetical protein [Citrobacter sp. Cb023]MDM3437631.1 hypothetical protein [Citrobacter sp. Cb034]
MQWTGFHGTSVFNASSIMSSTFRISSGKKDWLGSGAYFFIEAKGLLEPIEKAAQWANSRAPSSRPRYSSLSVLEALIETESFLDFNDDTHIAALNLIRDEYMKIIKEQGKRPTGEMLVDKCAFCNYVMCEHDVDAIVRKEYIKTTAEELNFGVDAGIPNCRVMCVKDPAASIKSIRYAVERRKVQ